MNYLKAAAAVVAAALAALVAALSGDNRVDATEWTNVVILAAGAAAVFAAPNVPGARYTKLILAVLTAVATAAVSLITDGISLTDWLQLVLAGLGAVGVWASPYSPEGASAGMHTLPPPRGGTR